MPTRILLIGAGAIGTFYGSRLAQAPHTLVSALCRSNYNAVKTTGFKITSPKFEEVRFKPEHLFSSPAEARKANVDWDYLLVATKALPDVSDDSALLEGLVGPGTSIVLVQNGIGIEEPYERRFPKACILSGVTIASVAQPTPGHIRHDRWMKLTVGPYMPEGDEEQAMQSCSRFVELLKAAKIADAELLDHAGLQFVRWHKVAINAVRSRLLAIRISVTSDMVSTRP